MTFNDGGAIVAMAGDKCFAIGVDHLLIQGDFVVTEYEQKVQRISPHLYMVCPGLYADAKQFSEKMFLRNAQYERAEQKPIPPDTFASIASWELYSRKHSSPFFINPIVAGFYPDTFDVFLSTLDITGCETRKQDFVSGGTGQYQIMGLGETLWQPCLCPDELFEVCSKMIVAACERDQKSGWGATVYVVEPKQVSIRKIATRMD